jgi:opacity protein-like surface antigen
VGGRLEWRLFGTTGVELSADWLKHDRDGQFFEANGHTTLLGVSLLHRFGERVAQPYVLGGLSLASHSGSTRFDDLRTERDSTDIGYHFGGGLAIRVSDRVEVGPEARFYMIQPENDSDPAFANWFGGRVGIRF